MDLDSSRSTPTSLSGTLFCFTCICMYNIYVICM
jgi:hypothetical protein